jgi:hypothetical protein
MPCAPKKGYQMTKENTATKSTGGEATAETAQPSLDLQDLAQMTALLQIAVKRGAFDMEELENVLPVHKKVSAFLQHQAQIQAAAQAAQKAETEGES